MDHCCGVMLVRLQDMHKLMNKDKIILRFTAKMTPGQSAVSHADAGELQQLAGCTPVYSAQPYIGLNPVWLTA